MISTDIFCHSIIPYLSLRDFYNARRTNIATYEQYQHNIRMLLQSRLGEARILTLALQTQDQHLLDLIIGNLVDDYLGFFSILDDMVDKDLASGSLDLVVAIASNVAWDELSSYVDGYSGWRELVGLALEKYPDIRKIAVEREYLRYLWKDIYKYIFESSLLDGDLLEILFTNLKAEDLHFDPRLIDIAINRYQGCLLDPRSAQSLIRLLSIIHGFPISNNVC